MEYQNVNNQNLDVDQMQADLAAQSAMYSHPRYGDQQSMLTQARASFGDIPAMMVSGAHSVGMAGYGAVRGAGNLLSAVGQNVMPATYMPPARVSTGFYGQYAQTTGFFKGMGQMFGVANAPYGVSEYKWGHYGASDFGERVGGGLSSVGAVAAGTAGMFAGTSIGGAIGGILGAPLGPVGAALGSGIGSLAGGMLGYTGIADTYGEAIAQRREMNAFLESSSFRYVGAGTGMADPRVGGMGMGARKQVTDFMRQIDVKDVSMNFEDVSNVMKGATSLGLLTGVGDIEDFKKKFKDIVDGVKVVSKTLNTTLQEGLQVMKDLKGIGVDPSSMGRLMFQADTAGLASGRTAHEVVNLGLQGAELYRGTGVDMQIGYQSNVMNLSSIRAARDAKLLSQEAISQAGGEEALAQRITASGLGFMQSAMGRGYGAAFFHPGAGTAGFDRAAFMRNMSGGGMDAAQLAMQAARNLSDPSKLIEFEAYQEKYMSEMGKAFGGDTSVMMNNAAMAQAQFLVKSGATKDITAAFRLTMKEQGRSESEIEEALGRIKGADSEFERRRDAASMATTQRRVDEAMATRGFGYLYDRAADIGKSWFIDPVVNTADKMTDSIKSGAIRFYEEKAVGIHRESVKGLSYSQVASRASLVGGGVDDSKSIVNLDESWSFSTKGAIVAGAAIAAGGAASFFSGGTLLPAMAAGAAALGTSGVLSFAESQGRTVAKSLENLQSSYPELKGMIKSSAGPGDIILEQNGITGEVKAISKENYNKATSLMSSGNLSLSSGLQMYQEGKATKGKQSLLSLYGVGAVGEGAEFGQLASAMFGKSVKDLSIAERAQLIGEAKNMADLGVSSFMDTVTKEQESIRASIESKEGVATMEVGEAVKTLGSAAKTLSQQMGFESKFLPGGRMDNETLMQLSMARVDYQAAMRGTDGKGIPLSKVQRGELMKRAEAARDLAIETYKKGSGKGEDLSDVISKFRGFVQADDRSYDAMAKDVYSASTKIASTQAERGGEVLTQLVDAETGAWTKDAEVLGARKAVKAFITEGFSGVASLSSSEIKSFQNTAVGRRVYQEEKTFKALEGIDEKLKTITSTEERTTKTREALEGVDIPFSKKQELISLSADQGKSLAVAHSKNMASQLASIELSTGSFQGMPGSLESKGTAQGNSAEQAAAQLNINLEVLTALRALSSQLKK